MAVLKKSSILLLLAMFAMFGSGTASAQPALPLTLGVITCTATAVPPVVRAEGIAELVGDIVLACTNIPPGIGGPLTSFLVTNISVSLNVNVTNNINYGKGSTITDAVLIINENNCVDPNPLGSVFDGDGAAFPACTATTADSDVQHPQFGSQAAPNRLEWNEVAFNVPGALRPGEVDCSVATGDPANCFPLVTTLRITSLRANASQLGVPDQATFPSTQITAFVSITGPTTIPVTNNVLNVAVPILGLIVSVGPAVAGLQCLDTSGHTYIDLKEGFATSFKTLGVATFTPGNTQWESGYYSPMSNNGAGATQGTRFLIRFSGIPEGVDLDVDYYIDNGSSSITGDAIALALVTGTDGNGAGGSVTANTSGTTSVSLSGGAGVVVYEVLDSNPFRVETCRVELWFSWVADTVNDLPEVTSGGVTASFAPLSTVIIADLGAPEPRFIDNSGDPETIISIARCTTTILFPFVTNQAGFDTGMAISNTSQDWLGTEPQDGTCTLHYHGSTLGGGAAPLDQTSTVIAGGEQLLWTLSSGNLAQNIEGGFEFQGYIIAICEFQYGHGYAFITDGFGGIPSLAQGYLALVIPVTVAGRLAGIPGLHTLGETLLH